MVILLEARTVTRLSCNGSEKGGGRPFDTDPIAWGQVHWAIVRVCIDAVENGVMNETAPVFHGHQRNVGVYVGLGVRDIL